MRHITKTVRVQPYDIPVTYTTNLKKFLAISNVGKTSNEDEYEGTVGCTDHARKGGGYTIGVFDGDLATLVHECVHTAAFILSNAGIELIQNHSEPMAYLVDYLYREGSKYMKQSSLREAATEGRSGRDSAINNSSTIKS